MPESVSINKDLGIIEVYSYGNVTQEDLDSSLAEVIQIEKDTGIKKVLVDTTKQEAITSFANIFNFAEKLPHTIRFAIVVSENQKTKDKQDFFETIAVNRCFNVKEFCSKAEAIDWLNS